MRVDCQFVSQLFQISRGRVRKLHFVCDSEIFLTFCQDVRTPDDCYAVHLGLLVVRALRDFPVATRSGPINRSLQGGFTNVEQRHDSSHGLHQSDAGNG